MLECRNGEVAPKGEVVERRPTVVTAAGETSMSRVLIASAIRLYREGLADSLARTGRLEIVGTASDAAACLEAIRTHEPDVVLIDLTIDDALAAVRAVAGTGTRLIALGVHEVESDVVEAAEAGVSGYVGRDTSLPELVKAVECTVRGESPCPPSIAALLLGRLAAAARVPSPDLAARLTPREAEIVALIDEGLSNKQIARRLSIESATVKNHVHNILEKLDVTRRGEAAAALRHAGGSGSPAHTV
jgi:two-component system nitrate/nitrite response regulator NarL